MSQTLTFAPTAGRRRIPEFTLGDKLLKARSTAGLTQTELSEIIGISKTAIGTAERGASTPHRSTLMLWASATDVDLEWLLESLPVREPRAPQGAAATHVAKSRRRSANKVT